MTSFLGNNSLHTFLSSSKLPNSQNPKCLRYKVTYASPPARDKTIDFGKYKGRMLGTLPSTYLKWVSNNLRARDFEEWAKLADQVLEDPVYKDRMEWESAQKLLNGDVLNVNSKPEGVVAELLEVSQRFGWDNEDEVGWSKIDFQLLGTSKGGRIPRVKEKLGVELASMKRVEVEARERRRDERNEGGSGEVGVRERRDERRDRLRMKRGKLNMNKNNRFGNAVEQENEGNKYWRSKESSDSNGAEVYSPFPGRETLLNKVLNRRRVG